MKHILNTLYILTPESYLFLQNETIGVKGQRGFGFRRTQLTPSTVLEM